MRRAGGPLLKAAMVVMAVATVALVPVFVRAWRGRGVPAPARSPVLLPATWTTLGPQARCDSALALVTAPEPWPMRCRWRTPDDNVQGSAFPPPKGEPPYDDPHIEVYLEPAQTMETVAHAIAHELGHMRHTREPTFVPEWLAARHLPADTPSAVWTEDYAETFAALFSPRQESWRAPTTRPGEDEMESLKVRFFS